MTRLPLGLAALATASLLLSGCAATGDTTPPASDQQQPTPSADVDTPTTGDDSSTADPVLGTVTVDGVGYDITELRNCEPLSDGPIERELELQGLGVRDGDRYQIDVYVQTIGGTPFDDVSWAGPEGIFGGSDNGDVTHTGDRVRGTATLLDAKTHTDRVAIEFDLEVPAETVACR